MRFACPRCQLALVVKKNGVTAEIMSDFGSYQLYDADLLECPGCAVEIISNFGSRPLAEHYQKPYYERIAENLRHRGPWFRVWNSRRDKERCAAG